MKTSTERILTTHTGSLHRPKDLEELFRKKLAGEPHDEAAFEQRLRSGVAKVVKKQADIGIDIIDDGELSKVDFFSYAKYRMEGIEQRPVPKQSDQTRGVNKFLHPAMKSVMSSVALRQRFAEFYADTEPPTGVTSPPNVIQMYLPVGSAVEPPAIYACVGPLKYKKAQVQRDIDNFKAALAGVTVEETFMPVVAPAMFATRHINEYYKSDEDYYFAIADVLHEEYSALVDAGFLIQIDDVSLPGRYRIQVPDEGMEAFKAWMDLAVRALNHALRGIPEEKVRYHLCWSSQNAPHTDDAPLSDLMEAMLKINAQGYQVEASNVRHGHEWMTWKEFKIPDHKIAMPGVICHATNVVEHPEYVSQLIQKYTDVLGRERVIAATDCGFRWRVHPQIAWAKLEALVEGARLASKALWRQ
ncbi:MAG: epoxyalkane--coenzyme M transferase [Rhizobiales bacterium]|nr:epoxyalkane--coenzyme M transferase [Hyphomicrobiales bacterium]